MTTLYLRPDGVGYETSISTQIPSEGAHWDKVDEVTPDEGATEVIQQVAGNARDLYSLEDTALTGTINWVRAYVRVKWDQIFSLAYLSIRTNGVTYDIAIEVLDTWDSYYNQWTTNPQTGNNWTWDEVNALQAGVVLSYGSDKVGFGTECTQVYVEVDYNPVVAPTVLSVAADSVEQITGNPKGNVTDAGGENPSRYIDYDIDSGEPYAYSKDCGVGGTGIYNSNLTGLIPGKKYYYRARAVNSGGTGTGSEMTFITKSRAVSAHMAAKLIAKGVI